MNFCFTGRCAGQQLGELRQFTLLILKAKMISQLSSKTMANSNWRTCTFTEVRGEIQGRIKDFFNGGRLIPIGHQTLP